MSAIQVHFAKATYTCTCTPRGGKALRRTRGAPANRVSKATSTLRAISWVDSRYVWGTRPREGPPTAVLCVRCLTPLQDRCVTSRTAASAKSGGHPMLTHLSRNGRQPSTPESAPRFRHPGGEPVFTEYSVFTVYSRWVLYSRIIHVFTHAPPRIHHVGPWGFRGWGARRFVVCGPSPT